MESTKENYPDLTNLGLLLKEKIKLVTHETTQMNQLKKEIRALMVEHDLPDFENEEFGLTIKCQRSFSFDIGAFKLEMPGFSASFITEETTTKTEDVLSAKQKTRLMERYPDDYKKYLVENTPRLTVR